MAYLVGVITRARTSAIHATDIEQFQKADQSWVRFTEVLDSLQCDPSFELPVYHIHENKNTSGIPEERVINRTALRFAGRTWPISVSHSNRSDMRKKFLQSNTYAQPMTANLPFSDRHL